MAFIQKSTIALKGIMVFEIPTDLSPQLAPLSWLIGSWSGSGIIEYIDREDTLFTQEIIFKSYNTNFLEYTSCVWLVGNDECEKEFLTSENGFWQLSKELKDSDPGPALLPPKKAVEKIDVFEVEKLRNPKGGFDITVNIAHPGGISELYLGLIDGPKITLTSDAIVRSAGSKLYTAARRMYGLVGGDLLWAWDIMALGNSLQSHASARLQKVS